MSSADTSPAEVLDVGDDVRPRSALYRAVWRWHFYAGIFAIPVIVILALSGIVYLFKPQIEAILYSGQTTIEPGTDTVSYQEQLETVQAEYPDWPVVAMEPPAGADQTTRFHLDNGGTGGFEPAGQTVFVNPYTGEIEGSRNNAHNPAQIAVQIHGSLMSANWLGDPKWGDMFLELVAGWTVVLVVTGIYLWFPRGRTFSWKGTFVPRLSLKGARVPWRDVHAITGVTFAFIFLFFLLTGLMWTSVWGAKYSELAASFNSSYPEVPSESTPPQTVGDMVGEGRSSWAQSEIPVLPSGKPVGNHAQHGDVISWDPSGGAPLDAIVAEAQSLGFETGYVIFWPEGETGSYYVARWPDMGSKPNQSAFDEKTAFIDQYSAETIGTYDYQQFGLMAKATDLGISLHEGREWGLVSQLLALAGTLAILVSCATAVVMWYKRRPRGLGAPRRIHSPAVAVGFIALTLTLGVFFPLVGISLIALFIVDYVLLRRIPPLARFFGMSGPATA